MTAQQEKQSPPTASTPDVQSGSRHANAYWRANLRIIAILLSVWFTVSFGFGILFVKSLNEISFFGFKFGFWWAQQGAIFVFVILIFVYAAWMERLDRRFGVSDDDAPSR